MDIFVKYPNDETLHHYRTGDGEGSDAASFRAGTLGGRRDLQLFDAEGVELDADEAAAVEEAAQEEIVFAPEGAGVEPVAEEEPATDE